MGDGSPSGNAPEGSYEDASDDEDAGEIFAYVSTTGIVTPAKAAMTPASAWRSTAKKTRYLHHSSPYNVKNPRNICEEKGPDRP